MTTIKFCITVKYVVTDFDGEDVCICKIDDAHKSVCACTGMEEVNCQCVVDIVYKKGAVCRCYSEDSASFTSDDLVSEDARKAREDARKAREEEARKARMAARKAARMAARKEARMAAAAAEASRMDSLYAAAAAAGHDDGG